MGAIDLDVPVGPHDQQPGPLEVARQVDEQVEGAPIGPVQVLEYEEQRLDPAGVAQEPGHGLEQPPALLFRIARGPGLHLHPLPDLGDDAGDVGRPTAQLLAERLWRTGQHVGAERLHKGEIGQRQRALLVGVPDEGAPPAQGDVGGELLAEGGLPDTGLADDGE